MNEADEIVDIRIRPRASEDISVRIPVDTLASLERIASSRDMSVDALLRFYIGQGLRQDLVKQYAERVLETTARVLERHIPSEEERASILREIRGETIR